MTSASQTLARRLALTVALSASLATSASAWSLWGPTLPPAPGVVAQIEKEVARSKGKSAEFEECKERFRNRIKGNFGAAASAKDNGDELTLFDVVSVYLIDSTVDPFTCRIKAAFVTEKLRDVGANSFFAFRDVLVAAHEINQPGNYSPLDQSDAAIKILNAIWGGCKPNDWSLTKFETEELIVYCQLTEPKYAAITYGLIFKSEIGK